MANVRIKDITATTQSLDGTNDYLVVDEGDGTTKKFLPAVITNALIDTGTATNLGFATAALIARAKTYIGNFVANAAKRLGDIVGDGVGGAREYYITRAAVAASAGTAKTDATVFARIDNPPNMTDAQVTLGNSTTPATPNPAQLKSAVETHRPAMANEDVTTPNANPRVPSGNQLKLAVDTFAHIAIRDGANEANGIKFDVRSQTSYDGLTGEDGNPSPNANTVYFITG